MYTHFSAAIGSDLRRCTERERSGESFQETENSKQYKKSESSSCLQRKNIKILFYSNTKIGLFNLMV